MESWYDKEEDILNVQLSKENYWKSVEIADGITIDIDKDGRIIAIEILNASKKFSGDIRKVIEVAKQSVPKAN